MKAFTRAGAAAALTIACCGQAQTPPARSVTVDAQGNAHVANATIPPSNIMSPEALAIILKARPTEGPGALPAPTGTMDEIRRTMNERLQPNVAHMGPEHRFPAATEDFTKVYRAMLKTYKAANIGFVGCSAGGALVAQTIAALPKAGLPRPAVAGIYCSGANANWMTGDSASFAGLVTAAVRPKPAATSARSRVNIHLRLN